jgi:hypothetical protein
MNTIVILAGTHWLQVSPVIFTRHGRNDEWCQVHCSKAHEDGAFLTFERESARISVPLSAVVAVAETEAGNPMGFRD